MGDTRLKELQQALDARISASEVKMSAIVEEKARTTVEDVRTKLVAMGGGPLNILKSPRSLPPLTAKPPTPRTPRGTSKVHPGKRSMRDDALPTWLARCTLSRLHETMFC